MDGVSKVSFNFLYTLWVYSTCIYLLIYILKNCNQDPYGFENLISSWGSWSKISKLHQVGDFFFGLKVHFLNTRTRCNFENHNRTNQLVEFSCTFYVLSVSSTNVFETVLCSLSVHAACFERSKRAPRLVHAHP